MSVGPVFDFVTRWAGTAGVPALLLWLLKERRKERIAARVAERTENADVRVKDAGALVAEVTAIEQAFEAERGSYERRLAEQGKRINGLKAEIDDLRRDKELLQRQVAHLMDQMAALRAAVGEE